LKLRAQFEKGLCWLRERFTKIETRVLPAALARREQNKLENSPHKWKLGVAKDKTEVTE